MPRFTKDTAKRFTPSLPFADVELAAESKALVAHMHRYIMRQFGPRCGGRKYEPECPVCEMWKRHDSLKAYICD